jgi:hypothetical protein
MRQQLGATEIIGGNSMGRKECSVEAHVDARNKAEPAIFKFEHPCDKLRTIGTFPQSKSPL